MRRLVREQRALERQPAAVAREAARSTDHAVTRHDEPDRIRTVRRADAARGLRLPDRPSNLAVAARLAVRDRQQRVPDGALEFRAARCELEIEDRALASCIFVDLSADLRDRG